MDKISVMGMVNNQRNISANTLSSLWPCPMVKSMDNAISICRMYDKVMFY